MKKSILLTSLAATLACGGSQLSGADEKGASSSLQASLQAPSTPTLTVDECNFFGQSGTFNICHVNGSGKFVSTAVTTSGCVNGHIGHAQDYIATNVGCPGDKAAAIAGGACFPAGAPVDATIPCCSRHAVDGRCADVCEMTARGDAGGWRSGPIPYSLFVPAGAICNLMNAQVNGNTHVEGNLYTIGSTFNGAVSVSGPGSSLTTANWGNMFNGGLSITNSDGDGGMNGFWSDYSPTTIAGDFTYTGNTAPLYVEGSTTVTGTFTYSHPCSWDTWWWYLQNPYWTQINASHNSILDCFN